MVSCLKCSVHLTSANTGQAGHSNHGNNGGGGYSNGGNSNGGNNNAGPQMYSGMNDNNQAAQNMQGEMYADQAPLANTPRPIIRPTFNSQPVDAAGPSAKRWSNYREPQIHSRAETVVREDVMVRIISKRPLDNENEALIVLGDPIRSAPKCFF